MCGATPALLYTPLAIGVSMAKAYKVTSDPFFVNGNITETALNTYTELEISLPLDSLNQEGILVHAVYWTSGEPSVIPGSNTSLTMQLTTTTKAGIVGANDANLIARQEKFITSAALEVSSIVTQDFIGTTGPYRTEDNLMLMATNNIFLAISGVNNSAARSGQFRMVCSRVKLESGAYAALVTNELTS